MSGAIDVCCPETRQSVIQDAMLQEQVMCCIRSLPKLQNSQQPPPPKVAAGDLLPTWARDDYMIPATCELLLRSGMHKRSERVVAALP